MDRQFAPWISVKMSHWEWIRNESKAKAGDKIKPAGQRVSVLNNLINIAQVADFAIGILKVSRFPSKQRKTGGKVLHRGGKLAK